MYNYRKTRLVDTIINKTNKLFCVYEETSGHLVCAYPDGEPLPDESQCPIFFQKGHVFVYVVTPEQLKLIKKKHPYRRLDDIGVLEERLSIGRHGAPIGKIHWAMEPNVRVLLYRNVNACTLPHK